MPSVLGHCWLGVRKSIRPVKTSDEVLAWSSVWSEMQMILHTVQLMPLPPIVSCFIKIQNGFTFWCRLTQAVLEKRPLDGCLPLHDTIAAVRFYTQMSLSRHQQILRISRRRCKPKIDMFAARNNRTVLY